MKLFLNQSEFIDTKEPIDISLSLSDTNDNPKAWYVKRPRFEPVRSDHYVGSVKEGGDVNFRDIYFNPHGHGTHTECLGHITTDVYSINQTLKEYFYKALLISVEPDENGQVIKPEQLSIEKNKYDACIIRTLPNKGSKKTADYSNTNPPYLDVNCVKNLLEAGIKHLLVDLPSVDKESDGGVLAFHHAFWEVPSNPNFERTITELIFVDDSIKDGEYILNFQVAPFENDASPSRPVLYKMKKS